MKREGSVLSAALLLAGYCIGIGYYAIPIVAGPAGFFPAVIMIILVGLYLLATSLLYLEAILISPDGANLTSIAYKIIGPVGMVIGVISFSILNYLFISNFYNLFSHFFTELVPIHVAWVYLGITLVFGGVVFLGTYASDRLNFILFTGFLVTFCVTVILSSKGVRIGNLMNRQWYLVSFSVPAILAALDYHSMLPTLSTYLKRNPKRLVTMTFISIFISYTVYISWTWLTIGSTTRGILWEAFESSHFAVGQGFLILAESHKIKMVFETMTLFAIATSLIATGLAIVDFLSDAFKIPLEKRVGLNRFYACLGTFIPCLLMSILIPGLIASDFLIGWAEVIFNGVIPIWLATRARYILKLDIKHLLPGGKAMIVLLIIASFFLVYLEGVHLLKQ